MDKTLEYTGERIIPGVSPAFFLQEQAARYAFAARFCEGKRVLDVASGAGYGTDYLRRKGAACTGLEIDAQAVRYAQHWFPDSDFVCGNAEELGDEWRGQFDCVVSFETIEHLSHPEKFLEGVSRCLRAGGIFLCSTPNKNLHLLEGGHPFHKKEFYRGEFLRFIGTRFQVLDVLGQSFHPAWHRVLFASFSLSKKLPRLARIRSLGIGATIVDRVALSPLRGVHAPGGKSIAQISTLNHLERQDSDIHARNRAEAERLKTVGDKESKA
ncbi:MAG: class I SAM-dependent methyltransferase [Candidatus Acidiferrales bacterium]